MNVFLAPLPPLPAVLAHPSSSGPFRRHRIGDFPLKPSDVEHFNQLLSRLGRHAPPLDCDCLATAARELRDTSGTSPPGCIRQRVRRAMALSAMLGEPSWEPADEAALVASQVIEYLRNPNDLIPDDLPQVGLLDDAIVVDTVWDRVVREVASYLDFRRLRRVEAALRGRSEFSFTRGDWEEARRAEVALAAHRQAARTSSYLAAGPALFRIH